MSQPQMWPGWETVRTLGHGTCGTVYEISRADDPTGSYRAALKVIRVPHSEEDLRPYLDSGCDPTSVQAIFRRQADEIISHLQNLRSLNVCPQIVGYEDHRIVSCADGMSWEIRLRMRLLTPAAAYFIKNGINEQKVLRLGTDLAQALEMAAAQNIRHGGIKPENIFVDENGTFMLADFGMAAVGEMLSVSPTVQTRSFLAPELYQGKTARLNADLYSLGLVLYWFLNDCKLPFWPNGASSKDPVALQQAQQIRFGGKELPLPAHGSKATKHSVLAACEFDPDVRFTAAAAFRTALLSCAEQNITEAAPVAPVAPPAAPVVPVAPAAAPVAAPLENVAPFVAPVAPPVVPATVPAPREPEDIARYYEAAPEPYIPQQKPKVPQQQPKMPRMIDESEPTYHPGGFRDEKKKVSVPLIITLAALLVLLLGLCGWFLYDHFLSPGNPDEEETSASNGKEPEKENGEEDGSVTSDEEASVPEEDTAPAEDDEEADPGHEEDEEETEETSSTAHPADAVEWNGHYYYIYDSSDAGNWDDAKLFCEQKGGYLASVASEEEDRFLYELLVDSGMKNAYFGYTDRNSEGKWHWANEESSSYTNWYPGEPNNYSNTEHYAMYYVGYTDGTWNDDNGLMYSVNPRPITVTDTEASSELEEPSLDLVNTADRAVDDSVSTVWVEGAEGQGIGETLTLTFSSTEDIVAFTIYAGYQSSQELYDKNSRPRVIELRFSDGTVADFRLEDYFGSQTIYFSRPVTASSVTIKIKDVYEGDQWDDTAISEISFLSGTLNTGFICEWDS